MPISVVLPSSFVVDSPVLLSPKVVELLSLPDGTSLELVAFPAVSLEALPSPFVVESPVLVSPEVVEFLSLPDGTSLELVAFPVTSLEAIGGADGACDGLTVGNSVGLAVGNSVNPSTKHSNSSAVARVHRRLASFVSWQVRSSTSPSVVPVSTTH